METRRGMSRDCHCPGYVYFFLTDDDRYMKIGKTKKLEYICDRIAYAEKTRKVNSILCIFYDDTDYTEGENIAHEFFRFAWNGKTNAGREWFDYTKAKNELSKFIDINKDSLVQGYIHVNTLYMHS